MWESGAGSFGVALSVVGLATTRDGRWTSFRFFIAPPMLNFYGFLSSLPLHSMVQPPFVVGIHLRVLQLLKVTLLLLPSILLPIEVEASFAMETQPFEVARCWINELLNVSALLAKE